MSNLNAICGLLNFKKMSASSGAARGGRGNCAKFLRRRNFAQFEQIAQLLTFSKVSFELFRNNFLHHNYRQKATRTNEVKITGTKHNFLAIVASNHREVFDSAGRVRFQRRERLHFIRQRAEAQLEPPSEIQDPFHK